MTVKRKARKEPKAKKNTPRDPKSARKAVASTEGEDEKPKTAGQGDFAPNQPLIKGFEDVDERITELDEECQRYLSAKERQKDAKQEADEAAEEIVTLIHKHELTHYKLNGKKFYIEPGAESVKCGNVEQKG